MVFLSRDRGIVNGTNLYIARAYVGCLCRRVHAIANIVLNGEMEDVDASRTAVLEVLFELAFLERELELNRTARRFALDAFRAATFQGLIVEEPDVVEQGICI